MSEQNRFMLMFTLGPVQPFIAQARKTRDFWIGSLLLSMLMEAAMEGITDDFIFPATRTVGEIPDIPNKYIAVFDELSQAQDAAQKSKQQIAKRWGEICNAVWGKIVAPHSDDETRRIWRRQTGVNPITHQVELDSFFEVYWAIARRETGQEYGDWFEATESLLAARKRLRDFRAGEEPGEKSAISGEREVLRRERTSILQFWQDIARSHSAMDIDQEGKERLDAIDLVKRFAMRAEAIVLDGRPFQKPFPSTSSIATASFAEKLLECAGNLPSQVLKDWYEVTRGRLASKELEATRDIPYLERKSNNPSYLKNKWILQRDGDLYFAETFVPRRLEKDYGIGNKNEAEAVAKRGNCALRALLRAVNSLKISRPTPYYAVVQMDGDNMGILLSGVKGRIEHGNISRALSSFARNSASALVEQQYPARLVYAGGDDVLAFAPLARDTVTNNEPRQILNLVDQLQQTYQAEVRKALPEPRNTEDETRLQNVTASTGVVIAHHYTSLSYVLRSAREAESAAKKIYGKNALVVTLLRRSGEQTRVGCRWRYPQLGPDEAPGQPIALFSRFYELLKDDVLSPKCVYTLLEEAPALVDMGVDLTRNRDDQPSAMQSEIKRVLKRQRNRAHKDSFSDDAINAYAWHLTRLAAAMDADEYPPLREKSVELHTDGRRYGLVEVLGWLLVMAFLVRKGQE